MSVDIYLYPPAERPTDIILRPYGLIIAPILRYQGSQTITVSLTGDYKTDRELIFGKGGFIKDKPLVKATMMICGYLKSKYYVTPEEIFEDKIIDIYQNDVGKWFFIEITSALMARVTNYFQSLQGVRDEDKESIKNDINAIIDEMIKRLKKEDIDINFIIEFDDINQTYTVTLEVYQK